MTEYVSITDTAKLARATLKKAFPSTCPGVKFSVRSDRYADGASVRGTWAYPTGRGTRTQPDPLAGLGDAVNLATR